jgi:hypothetical protein
LGRGRRLGEIHTPRPPARPRGIRRRSPDATPTERSRNHYAFLMLSYGTSNQASLTGATGGRCDEYSQAGQHPHRIPPGEPGASRGEGWVRSEHMSAINRNIPRKVLGWGRVNSWNEPVQRFTLGKEGGNHNAFRHGGGGEARGASQARGRHTLHRWCPKYATEQSERARWPGGGKHCRDEAAEDIKLRPHGLEMWEKRLGLLTARARVAYSHGGKVQGFGRVDVCAKKTTTWEVSINIGRTVRQLGAAAPAMRSLRPSPRCPPWWGPRSRRTRRRRLRAARSGPRLASPRAGKQQHTARSTCRQSLARAHSGAPAASP